MVCSTLRRWAGAVRVCNKSSSETTPSAHWQQGTIVQSFASISQSILSRTRRTCVHFSIKLHAMSRGLNSRLDHNTSNRCIRFDVVQFGKVRSRRDGIVSESKEQKPRVAANDGGS